MSKYSPKFYRRWAEVYLQKKREYGVEEAKAWANRFLPSSAVPYVQAEIKKIKTEEVPQP